MSQTICVCIVAENASYRFGGEAVLPLHYFARLRARGIDAWLVTHARTRVELDQVFPDDRERIVYIEDSWFYRLVYRSSRLLPRRIALATVNLAGLLLSQWQQRRQVLKLIRKYGVNVVHQPTPVSPRLPSLMRRLGAPVLIGPMNGGMDYPPTFRNVESHWTRWGVALARSASNLVNQLLRGKPEARLLMVANERTRSALPRGLSGEVIRLSENGVDLNIWQPRENTAHPQSESWEFVFVGRLIDLKGLDIAIEALSGIPDARMCVIGDGPMRDTWQQLALSLGLSDRINFHGWASQAECAVVLRSAVAMVLPSYCECGGAVVLEAMAVGIPVIAVNWGGPADYLDSSCGILIEPENRAAMVRGFREAMGRLLASIELQTRLGATARARVVEQYDWERKLDAMIALYRRVSDASFSGRSASPTLGRK
uniref:Glycosyl transferase family 1 domain-containing protein n=1 Tax=mine drainage metagenome TaxID=410659 RepID=E6QMH1_9ZZZZ